MGRADTLRRRAGIRLWQVLDHSGDSQLACVWIGMETQTSRLDIALLLRIMWEQWNQVFKKTLGTQAGLVSELRDTRNRWARRARFLMTPGALDSVEKSSPPCRRQKHT